jgi:ring-1,2-phenylacetyl-CoA epoxidase subunit PaaD
MPFGKMGSAISITSDYIWNLLGQIPDPEVPAINIVELGVVRDVIILENGSGVEVVMTPTYSGCPAMKVMEDEVKEKLSTEGIPVKIKIIYKPAWTTEWMSDETKAKLKAYGISPPPKLTFEHLHPLSSVKSTEVICPFCDSTDTTLTSQFGSTACKALHYCNHCHQPFELFKCH